MKSLRKFFRLNSEFSCDDLVRILSNTENKSDWVAAILAQACWHSDSDGAAGIESFVFSRIVHTLGSALMAVFDDNDMPISRALEGLAEKLNSTQRKYLTSIGLQVSDCLSIKDWCDRAQSLGFTSLSTAILSESTTKVSPPKNSLRKDEIVWGRAPARLDTGGGWTDTPPYSLEYGGSVVNTAVDLNGQPPIQAYAKVIDEPVIRICSIDIGARTEIVDLDELLDYRKADCSFGLAKAAIALCGFSPDSADWPDSITLKGMLKHFGGGLEITTLAAIPKGSGLGTSSIVGAVLISVIKRVMGQTLNQRDLFNAVLKLEQALTTGGGWQDQIGGASPGSKISTAAPGIIPDASIHYLPADVIDPVINSGQTLLYYTGITRLAKNILEKVVGSYLDRERHTMATLRQIYASAGQVADAMSCKDIALFASLVDHARQLNVQLDPNSSNPAVEELLTRIRPHIFGAKLLGAGGGGFLFMVAKSPDHAKQIRQMLESDPPNERARFFDYSINTTGLTVTVC
jgi:galactokinase/mevalonate kinase-like predicted kinase